MTKFVFNLILGESTLQWSKVVVTNTTFPNGMTLNFHQTNMERGFSTCTCNSVVQNPKNKIAKKITL
jgi:hypothetical protein